MAACACGCRAHVAYARAGGRSTMNLTQLLFCSMIIIAAIRRCGWQRRRRSCLGRMDSDRTPLLGDEDRINGAAAVPPADRYPCTCVRARARVCVCVSRCARFFAQRPWREIRGRWWLRGWGSGLECSAAVRRDAQMVRDGRARRAHAGGAT